MDAVKHRTRWLLLLAFLHITCYNEETDAAATFPLIRHRHRHQYRYLHHSSDNAEKAIRQRRQHNANVNANYYYTENEAFVLEEYGNWSDWMTGAECTRSCGGGVGYEIRQCLSVGSNGFANCRGASKRYYSCNIQDCPDLADIRAQQCSAFDSVPFDKYFYTWVPYTKGQNKCELNCMPRGERFYYRHKKQVIDGTPCDDEKPDICVNGKCVPIGCDRLLGSPLREDKCRICGGDGSSCRTINDILTRNDLQVGYNDLMLVPAGAMNIRIRQLQYSNNYLAVRNLSNFYYLNGGWRIDIPKSFRFAGTVFHYDRIRDTLGFLAIESISALGPITESLYIVVLYQEKKADIEYEYSVTNGSIKTTDSEGYEWSYDAFSNCSSPCGGGYKVRKVWCAKKHDQTAAMVNNDLCDPALEPIKNQTCGQEACPPRWIVGEWSPCSQSCGINGTQNRTIKCEQVLGNGKSSLVDETFCETSNANSQKPNTTQSCNVGLPCPRWYVGPWKACDKLCGEGFQRREIKCYYRTEGGKITIAQDSSCSDPKPELEKPCFVRPCEGVDWIVTEWSDCKDRCDVAFETRNAVCSSAKGKRYPDSYCNISKRPEPATIRECETWPSFCEYQWYATQWSECSSTCGQGIQSRKVFCGYVKDDVFQKVADSKCEPDKKYATTRNCSGKAQCDGEWFYGPWSVCSKPCGGGVKNRTVLCMLANTTVDVTKCDAKKIVFKSDTCNNQPCGEDEIIPVVATGTVSEDTTGEECEEYEKNDVRLVTIPLPMDTETRTEIPNETSTGQTAAVEFLEQSDLITITGEPISSDSAATNSKDLATTTVDRQSSESAAAAAATAAETEIGTGKTTIVDHFTTVSSSSDLPSDATSSDVSSSSSDGGSSSSSSFSSTEIDIDIITTPISTEIGNASNDVDTTASSSVAASTQSTRITSIEDDYPNGTTTNASDGENSTDSVIAGSSTNAITTWTSTNSYSPSLSSSRGNDIKTSETTSNVESEPTMATNAINTAVVTKETTKQCKKKKKKLAKCELTEFGCCFDGIIAASGPFSAGCAEISSCKETKYGCCPDQVSPAQGPNNESCVQVSCELTLFGCCADNRSTALGNDGEGCPGPGFVKTPPPTAYTPSSASGNDDSTRPNRCADGDGLCVTVTDSTTTTAAIEENCATSQFGCCSDNETIAFGPNYTGCPEPDDGSGYGSSTIQVDEGGTTSPFHWTATTDGTGAGAGAETVSIAETGRDVTTILPANGTTCASSEFGCCADNVTAATGANMQGCCISTRYGCCPNNVTPAQGPHLDGCGCQYTPFGCCSDGETAAADESRVCACNATKYGCCPDGVQEAGGENYAGCVDISKAREICVQPKDKGSCRDFTVKWFFDTEYGGCSRFWYGGCDGNDNRFKTQEECRKTCVEPPGKVACLLPKISGPCEGYYPSWYYDSVREQCLQFIYGGCLGNNNKFQTLQECETLCLQTNQSARAPQIEKLEEPELESEEGSYVTLPCRASGFPTPTISWKKDGLLIEKMLDRYKFNKGFLQIVGTYVGDSGTYTCTADNGIGQPVQMSLRLTVKRRSLVETDSPAVAVTVTAAPTTPSTPSTSTSIRVDVSSNTAARIETGSSYPTDVAAEEGAYATFKCVASGFPTPAIQWQRGTTIIDRSDGRYKLNDGVLQVIGLYKSDAGSYICIADNGIGQPDRKEYKLTITDAVEKPADIISNPVSSVIVTLDAPSILHCYAYGYPRPAVLWWKEDTMLPRNSVQYEQRRDNSLIIRHVTLKALGPYTCQAYNGLGRAASWTTTLYAIGSTTPIDPKDSKYAEYLVPPPTAPTIQPDPSPDKHPATQPPRPHLTPNPPDIVTPSPSPQPGVYINPNCTDNPFFANCELIVKANYCNHRYYGKFCCRSCTIGLQTSPDSVNYDERETETGKKK